MKLSSLLQGIDYSVICGNIDIEVTGISHDNRIAKPSDVFICIQGPKFDTHNDEVIAALCDAGQVAFVVEKDIKVRPGFTGTLVKVKNARRACSFMYAAYYDHPATKLTLIGITGSKGKTTTTCMCSAILEAQGIPVGTIGTMGVDYAGKHFNTGNTTPDSYDIQKYLSDMVNAGVQVVVMEVSSQATKMHRVDGLTFDYGLWTNLFTGDHIGGPEHESFEDYLSCKAAFINQCKHAFLNYDDPYRDTILPYILKDLPLDFFGSDSAQCKYVANNIQKAFDSATKIAKVIFDAYGFIGADAPLTITLNQPGEFNVWNALCAMILCAQVGATADVLKASLLDLYIKGRSEILYRGDKFMICMDYAHNGPSTTSHLVAMREYHPTRLVAIISANGSRDINRRSDIGEAAGKLADYIIVTTGQNRGDSFEDISRLVVEGIKRTDNTNYIVIEDRREAIRYAVEHVQEGDFITIINPGNMRTQDFGNVVINYSDADYVKGLLQELHIQ